MLATNASQSPQHEAKFPKSQDFSCVAPFTIDRRERPAMRLGKPGLPKASRPRRPHDRSTFKDILDTVKASNVVKIKDRAFFANRLSKVVLGPSREVCYEVKNRAINALIRHRAAFVNAIDLSYGEPEIGISFAGGGRLHTRPAGLDRSARLILTQQLTVAIGNDSKPGESAIL